MGLDLYLYRVERGTSEDFEVNEKLPDTILRFSQNTKKDVQYYDLKKLSEYFGLPMEQINPWSFSTEGIHFYFGDRDNPKYRISDEDIKNFIITKTEDKISVTLEEIDYQHNGITDDGWKILEEIGNCVYCDNLDRVKELTQYGLSKSFVDNWIDGETVFEAWW